MASKFALVIANTEYLDVSFAKLTGPDKDVVGIIYMRDLLKSPLESSSK